MNEIRPENDVTRLSVPQVILLTLLVTIVSAMTTAIITVQLMSGIPGETVFQTIERVTETVVERPVTDNNPTTVVVKEGDLVARAIAENNNSSEAMYFGDESTEVILLGYGLVVSDNLLISSVYENPDRLVTAGLNAIETYGSDRVMLWQTTDGGTFTGKNIVAFKTGNPQLGQTMVYVGADGSIVRGIIEGVSANEMNFSEDLSNREIGLMLDIGGDVIGLWTGSQLIRSAAVSVQIDQLLANELYEVPVDTGFDVEDPVDTNPDDVSISDKIESCELIGGTLNEHDECLGIDQQGCSVLGGDWEECGSACRHDADAEICALQCEIYCQL